MSKTSRRTFIKVVAMLPLATRLNASVGNQADLSLLQTKSEMRALTKIGSIKLKRPAELASSPFGIGCETLDRGLWKPSEVYPFIKYLPVKWARLQTGWERVEKVKDIYDWDWLDESVDGLVEVGINPFFNVGYGNSLYSGPGVGYHPMNDQEALDGWKKFVELLVKRYRDRITHYEIWNEPNLESFWKPDKPDPAKYVALVKETVSVIHKIQPDAVIVGGVVSELPHNYIKRMFDVGLAEYIDIFSFHPYTTIPERYNERIETLKKLISQYKPTLQIWQGENGYPSEPGSSGYIGEGPWSENIQAKNMLRRLLIDCSLGLPMTLWFLIIDIHDYPKGTGKVNYKGVLRAKPEISPKPAFYALQYLGSVFYGDVKRSNAIVQAMPADQPFTEIDCRAFGRGERGNVPNFYASLLKTDLGPALAYWNTEKALDALEDKQLIRLILWDWEDSGIKEPVIVDPFTGDILEINCSEKMFNKWVDQEVQIFQSIPLRDYPLLIMEKGNVL